MELRYYRVRGGNFGDDLNTWLWDRLLPGYQEWSGETVLMGVGTLLKEHFLPPNRRMLVLGAGAGYGEPPFVPDEPQRWDVRAVRGPLTARAIGVPMNTAILDPAALISDLEDFQRIAYHGETVLVPHHSCAGIDWKRVCRGTGVSPISPTGDSEHIIRRIAGAGRVIAESLHAAIIADSFRVPWRAVSIGWGFNHFKWADWGQSLNMDIEISGLSQMVEKLHPGEPDRRLRVRFKREIKSAVLSPLVGVSLRRLAQGPYTLSNQTVLGERKQQLWDVLDGVRRTYGQGVTGGVPPSRSE